MEITSNAVSVFDQDEFLERLGGDYELAADVSRLFLDDCPRRIEAILAALRSEDAPALRTEAHGLKGAAGNMSAHHLAALARELEAQASAGRFESAMSMMDRLSDESDAALDAVRAFEATAVGHLAP